jgi:hypothetical protein
LANLDKSVIRPAENKVLKASSHEPPAAVAGPSLFVNDLPTPATAAAAHCCVAAWCRRCDRHRDLDLHALIECGQGNTPLIHLPLVCGQCGTRDFGITVSGARPGS